MRASRDAILRAVDGHRGTAEIAQYLAMSFDATKRALNALQVKDIIEQHDGAWRRKSG